MDVRNDVVPIADLGVCSHVRVNRQNEQSVMVPGGRSHLLTVLMSYVGGAADCGTTVSLKWL